MCLRFGTLCSIFIDRFIQPHAYEDGTECSETSEHKIQTPGNKPEESIQHLEQGGSVKSRIPKPHSIQFTSHYNTLKYAINCEVEKISLKEKAYNLSANCVILSEL